MTYISFWPVLVAAIVAFAIMSLWYSPMLFGKEWMTLSKIDAPGSSKGAWRLYIIQFIAMLVTFAVMAFIESTSMTLSSGDGAFIAFLIWLGFIAAGNTGELMWQKKPFKLVLIESIGTLISLMVGGAIIGAWH
ncbi:MAG: DUF1761 domain-containing protein [Patescibacteria group bacterium]|nr:DUF1761 domain-containing protein [Patescibacteria group bacterium]